MTGFSNFLNDLWASSTTGAGSTTTIVDTLLGRFHDDTLNERFFRITGAAHGAIWEVREATDFTQSTGTVTVLPAYGATTGTSVAYEMHIWDPARKFAALDAAIIALSDKLPQVVYDETITLDTISREYAIPSGIRKGPLMIQIEEPLQVQTGWNFLTNPLGDSTTSWTISSNGAESQATYTPTTGNDLQVPKYGNTAVKVTVPASTAVTVRQAVADMTNGASASNAAGRTMTMGMWVYCQVASRVTIEFIDDNGTVATSSAHAGGGWELLTATGTVSAGNATTLTAGISVTSTAAALELYWNHAWLFYGEQMPSYWSDELTFRPRRDDTTKKIILPGNTRGKRQLRIIGSGPLSTLGTTLSTQVTNSVEVDANTAEILYAKAAQILIGNQALSASGMEEIGIRIQVAEARLDDLQRQWRQELPMGPRIVGPYD